MSLCVTLLLVVLDSNYQNPCGNQKVVPPNLIVTVVILLLAIAMRSTMALCPMDPEVWSSPLGGVVGLSLYFPFRFWDDSLVFGGTVADGLI